MSEKTASVPEKEEMEFIILQYLDAGLLDRAEELALKCGFKESEWQDLRDTESSNFHDDWEEM
jgi:hypothetical protein